MNATDPFLLARSLISIAEQRHLTGQQTMAAAIAAVSLAHQIHMPDVPAKAIAALVEHAITNLPKDPTR